MLPGLNVLRWVRPRLAVLRDRLENRHAQLELLCQWLVYLRGTQLQWAWRRENRLWVFAARGGDGFVDNAKYLYLWTLENDSEIRPVFLIRNDETIREPPRGQVVRKAFGLSSSRKIEDLPNDPEASRGLVGHSHGTIGLITSNGVVGHGRGVHGPRYLPSSSENRRLTACKSRFAMSEVPPRDSRTRFRLTVAADF